MSHKSMFEKKRLSVNKSASRKIDALNISIMIIMQQSLLK